MAIYTGRGPNGTRTGTQAGTSRRRRGIILAISTGLVLMLWGIGLRSGAWWNSDGEVSRGRQSTEAVKVDFGKLPLSFEPNRGQTDPSVRYMTHASGGTMYFRPSEVVLALQSAPRDQPSDASGIVGSASLSGSEEASHSANAQPENSIVRLQFIGSNPHTEITSGEALPGKVNYFIGNDPSKWHSDVPTYSSTHYTSLYPGIDLKYEGTGGQLKGTFTVAPGADPALIHWRYAGAHSVRIDDAGNLQIVLNGDESTTVTEQAPVAWQEIGGEQVRVKVLYNLTSNNVVSFVPASYDSNYPLIIDPTLTYSTYLGGSSGESGLGIAVDSSGSAYVTGYTFSTNFPLVNPFQPVHGGGTYDAFVTKLLPDGSALVYSTYLGGSGEDRGDKITVDGSGSAYLTGSTRSANFPLADPFQPVHGGGTYDAFVTKLLPDGSALVYSSYLGGGGGLGDDYGLGIAVDSSGSAYVTGATNSTNFPLANPFQPVLGGGSDAYVTKLNPAGTALVYSTYLGGSLRDDGEEISVDGSGNVYLAGATASSNFPLANPFQPVYGGGNDAFVTKLNAAGNTLIYSTYLGGSGEDRGFSIAVDGSGNAYVTGLVYSTNFPLVDPFQPVLGGTRDAFVTKLNAAGSALVYSTYLGGSGGDGGEGIAVDSSGSAYVIGWTSSTNFPLADPFQPVLGGGSDAYITKLNPAGSALVYSTYLGGRTGELGWDIKVDSSGSAYVIGDTDSTNFPLVNPFQPAYAGGIDAFVAKISDQQGTPTPSPIAPSPSSTSTPVPPTATRTSLPSTFTPGMTMTVTPALTMSPGTPTTTNTPIATRTTCPMTFTDVAPTDYFYGPVRYLYCAGVISGYSDSTFRPYNNATRSQLTKIVVLAFGIPVYSPPQPTFTDVPATHPFYQYIETAAYTGIVSGYADDTFRPGNDVTRGQLSKIVVVAAAWSLVDPLTPSFTDVPRGSTFYSYIETAYDHDIISGYADHTFRPGNNATRGQISKIVYNAITAP